jgi:hypothetical protein
MIVDEIVTNEIKRIKQNAEWNPTPLETMEKLRKGEAAPAGDDGDFSMFIHEGIKVVYTHETQPGNIICKHLSISIHDNKKIPDLIITTLMSLFDFKNSIKTCKLLGTAWKESFSSIVATNIVEPLSGDFNDLMKKG